MKSSMKVLGCVVCLCVFVFAVQTQDLFDDYERLHEDGEVWSPRSPEQGELYKETKFEDPSAQYERLEEYKSEGKSWWVRLTNWVMEKILGERDYETEDAREQRKERERLGEDQIDQGLFVKVYRKVVRSPGVIWEMVQSGGAYSKQVLRKLLQNIFGPGEETREDSEDAEFESKDESHEQMLEDFFSTMMEDGGFVEVGREIEHIETPRQTTPKREKVEEKLEKSELLDLKSENTEDFEELMKQSMPGVNNLEDVDQNYPGTVEGDATHEGLRILIDRGYMGKVEGLVRELFELQGDLESRHEDRTHMEERQVEAEDQREKQEGDIGQIEEELEKAVGTLREKEAELNNKESEKKLIEEEIKNVEEGPMAEKLKKYKGKLEDLAKKISEVKREDPDQAKRRRKKQKLETELDNLIRAIEDDEAKLSDLTEEQKARKPDDDWEQEKQVSLDAAKKNRFILAKLRKAQEILMIQVKIKPIADDIHADSGKASDKLQKLYQDRQISEPKLNQMMEEVKSIDPSLEHIKELVSDSNFQDLMGSLENLQETVRNMDFDKLERELSNLNKLIAELEAQEEGFKKDFNRAKAGQKLANQELERLNGKIARLQDDKQVKEDQKDAVLTELEDIDQKLATFDSRLSLFVDKEDELDQKKTRLQQKYVKKLNEMQQEKDAKTKELGDAREEVEKAKEKIREQEARISEKKALANGLKNKHFHLTGKVQDLGVEIKALVDRRREILQMIRVKLGPLKEYVH